MSKNKDWNELYILYLGARGTQVDSVTHRDGTDMCGHQQTLK